MASEDIDFLFTNISVEETIDISVLFFCNLFNLVTKESCYMIKNKLYRQIDGVVVGSPLSTTMTWKKKNTGIRYYWDFLMTNGDIFNKW